MENADLQRREEVRKLGEMIRDIRIAMLTTVDDQGRLHSRPMASQEAVFDGDLWFFTKEHSLKVTEVMNERQVNVAMSNPHTQRYISMSGVAQLVMDPAKMASLWKPALKAWFPDGLQDPDLALLRVTVKTAEYWDTPPSKVVQVFGMAKAMASGTEYDAGDHQRVTLQ
jgi:general stress protein 26